MNFTRLLPFVLVTAASAADISPQAMGIWSWKNPKSPMPGWRSDAEMLILPRGMLVQCSSDLLLAVFEWKATAPTSLVFGPDEGLRKIAFGPDFTSYEASETWNGNDAISGKRERTHAPVSPTEYTVPMKELEVVLRSHQWSWRDAGQNGKGNWSTGLRFEKNQDLYTDLSSADRHWQWWITGPRHVHVQFVWHTKDPRPAFNADIGADLWFTADLKRFRGVAHDPPEFSKWAVVEGNVQAIRTAEPDAADSGFTSIQTDANQPRLEVIKDQGPNATEWALTPLDKTIPADIRQNLTLLREDLLDEGKRAAKAKPEAYRLASEYCDKLLVALDQRDLARVNAGYASAQADANKRTSTQALDARRNYKMSWPQYAREESQRAALRENEADKADVKKQRLKVEWTQSSVQMRSYLDDLYRRLREVMR